MYHKTQDYLSEEQTEQYTEAAGNQEQLVLAYFERNSQMAFSPETIQAAVLPDAPITSVRRAITNLTNSGKLERVGIETGSYGRPVGTWRLKRQVEEGFLF
jgi:predicted ArsR family transcriptional regulator